MVIRNVNVAHLEQFQVYLAHVNVIIAVQDQKQMQQAVAVSCAHLVNSLQMKANVNLVDQEQYLNSLVPQPALIVVAVEKQMQQELVALCALLVNSHLMMVNAKIAL